WATVLSNSSRASLSQSRAQNNARVPTRFRNDKRLIAFLAYASGECGKTWTVVEINERPLRRRGNRVERSSAVRAASKPDSRSNGNCSRLYFPPGKQNMRQGFPVTSSIH